MSAAAGYQSSDIRTSGRRRGSDAGGGCGGDGVGVGRRTVRWTAGEDARRGEAMQSVQPVRFGAAPEASARI